MCVLGCTIDLLVTLRPLTRFMQNLLECMKIKVLRNACNQNGCIPFRKHVLVDMQRVGTAIKSAMNLQGLTVPPALADMLTAKTCYDNTFDFIGCRFFRRHLDLQGNGLTTKWPYS